MTTETAVKKTKKTPAQIATAVVVSLVASPLLALAIDSVVHVALGK